MKKVSLKTTDQAVAKLACIVLVTSGIEVSVDRRYKVHSIPPNGFGRNSVSTAIEEIEITVTLSEEDSKKLDSLFGIKDGLHGHCVPWGSDTKHD